MPQTNHQAAIQEAYQALSPPVREIVDQKKLVGQWSPDQVIDVLLELSPYGDRIKFSEKAPKQRHKTTIGRQFGVAVILGSSLFGLFALMFDVPLRYVLIIGIGALGLGLGWVSFRWVRQWMGNRGRKTMQWQHLDFLLYLAALLKDEIRPETMLDLELDLENPRQKKLKENTHKNYLLLGHQVVLGSFWLLILIGLPWAIQQLSTFASEIMSLFVVCLVPLILILYLFVMMIAAAAFGETNKIKTRKYRCPQLRVKTTLADGTWLQVEVINWLALRRTHKKKFKPKNFQVVKVKRKHQTKTVTTLRLAFPLKKYQMSEERFKENFDRNWRIKNQKVAKVKLKSGEKRKTVTYQDVQTTQGAGYEEVAYASPDFRRFLELMSKGGFRALQQSVDSKVPSGKSRKKGKRKPGH